MRSASMMASLQSAHYRAGSLSEASRRKALVDLVLEEARRRRRGHELAMHFGRDAAVLIDPAVAELDLQDLRLGVVADRADLARIDALAFHVHSISSPRGLPVLDHQLQILRPIELVHRKPVRRAHGRRQGIERVEAHRLDGSPAARELELQMLLTYHALAEDLEHVAEQRLRETLAPDLVFEQLREAQIEIRGLERPVGLDRASELRGRQPFAGHGLEERRGAREIFRTQRRSGGGRVPPEPQQQPGGALGDEIERVAQMQARDRAARALDFAGRALRKREGRAMVAVLDAAGEDPDHALVPGRIVETDAARLADGELREELIGLEPHVRLDRAPLVVELVELPRDVQGAPAVRSDETLDPEAHVGKAPGGVQPRREQESQIEGAGARRIAAGDGEERAHALLHSARAYAPQPLSDQHAVVEIERHHVGDRAEGEEVERIAEVRLQPAGPAGGRRDAPLSLRERGWG